MPTPFFVTATYLAAIPIVIGLIPSVWSCLIVIANSHGIDLTKAIPWLHVEQRIGMPAPFFLFIVSAMAFAWGRKMGPVWLWYRIGTGGVLLGLITIPYWLALSFPEIWAIAACVLIWFVWYKFVRRPRNTTA